MWLSPAAVADQMNRATGAIHQATGRVPTLFRAPYGAWSPAVLWQCARTGMIPLDWSVDPRDWSRPGVASIVGNIMRNTRTGSIILEHDGGGDRSQTVAALKIVLPRLLAAWAITFTPPSPRATAVTAGGHADRSIPNPGLIRAPAARITGPRHAGRLTCPMPPDVRLAASH